MGTLPPLPIPHAPRISLVRPAIGGAARGALACRRQPGRRGRFVQKEERGSISVGGGHFVRGGGACTGRCVHELWICISRFSCGHFSCGFFFLRVRLNLMGFILFLRRGMCAGFANRDGKHARRVSCHEPDFRSKQAVEISRRTCVSFCLKCFLILTKTLSQDAQLSRDSCRLRYSGDITRSKAIEKKNPTVIIIVCFCCSFLKNQSHILSVKLPPPVIDSIANIPQILQGFCRS